MSEQYAVVVQNPVHYNIRAMVMGQVGGQSGNQPRLASLRLPVAAPLCLLMHSTCVCSPRTHTHACLPARAGH